MPPFRLIQQPPKRKSDDTMSSYAFTPITLHKTRVFAKKDCDKRKMFRTEEDAMDFATEHGYIGYEVISSRKSRSKSGGLTYYFYAGRSDGDWSDTGDYTLYDYNYDTVFLTNIPRSVPLEEIRFDWEDDEEEGPFMWKNEADRAREEEEAREVIMEI